MIRNIPIATDDGTMWTFIVTPAQPPRAAVVVLMEAFGINDHIRDVCGRFAGLGYLAIAPDLYHRAGRYITGPYDDPSTIMGHFADLTTEDMERDIATTIEHVGAAHRIHADRTAVIGFCLGGYGAVLAAVRLQPAIVAGFYGAALSIPRDGSPLVDEFDRIECPVHLFYGAEDPVIPPEEIEQTRHALQEAGTRSTVDIYAGAGHGFFCDQRGSHVSEAADHAWRRVTTSFTDVLGPPS